MPGATPLRESACRVSKTDCFLRFFLVGCTRLRESGCRVSKTESFLRFFFGRVHPSQGKRGSSVKNFFFLRFGGPETVLKTVLTILFASYGRFFERGKMSENRQKTSKTGFFLRFFFGRAPLSGKTRVECQKLGFFCVFGGPESVLKTVLTIRFASYETICFSIHGHPEPSSDGFRGVSEWFQSGSKLFFFLVAGQLVHVTWSCSFIIG